MFRLQYWLLIGRMKGHKQSDIEQFITNNGGIVVKKNYSNFLIRYALIGSIQHPSTNKKYQHILNNKDIKCVNIEWYNKCKKRKKFCEITDRFTVNIRPTSTRKSKSYLYIIYIFVLNTYNIILYTERHRDEIEQDSDGSVCINNPPKKQKVSFKKKQQTQNQQSRKRNRQKMNDDHEDIQNVDHMNKYESGLPEVKRRRTTRKCAKKQIKKKRRISQLGFGATGWLSVYLIYY